jgi:hypothetical protein
MIQWPKSEAPTSHLALGKSYSTYHDKGKGPLPNLFGALTVGREAPVRGWGWEDLGRRFDSKQCRIH